MIDATWKAACRRASHIFDMVFIRLTNSIATDVRMMRKYVLTYSMESAFRMFLNSTK